MKIFKSTKILFTSLVLAFGVSGLSAAAPVVESTAVTVATEGMTYSYELNASDADGDALTWSVTSGTTLPSWLSLPTTVEGFETVGVAGFSAGEASYTDIAFDSSGTPYVVYQDGLNGPATVMKFDSSLATPAWTAVGMERFSAGEAINTSIAFDSNDIPYVVYQDMANSGGATVMKFDSSIAPIWIPVGTAGFSSGEAMNTSIAFDSNDIPYVVYQDMANGTGATVMKFDSSIAPVWIPVGTEGFSAGPAINTSIAFDSNDIPYVVYQDIANGAGATVMKFGSSMVPEWILVGTAGFSAGPADYTSIAFDSNDIPYVVYQDAVNGSGATVMEFDSSLATPAWTVVGTVGFSAGTAAYTSIAFDSSDTPYVVYSDGGSALGATILKLSGSAWVSVGTPGFSADQADYTSIAIDGSGTPYVVYKDIATLGAKATVMKFSSPKLIGTPTNADVGVYDISLSVSDGVNIATQIFQITVADVNYTPIITSTATTTINQDSEYNYSLTGTDADGDTLTWSATSGTTLPSWLSLNSTDAVVTTLAGTSTIGSRDGTGTDASFYAPNGAAVDSSGNIYIADIGYHLIRKITPEGVVTTIAGTGFSGSLDGNGTLASFFNPSGVAIDSNDNLYVTDSRNHLIRKITPAGVVTTLAGTVGVSGFTDGTGTTASFNLPNGLAVDSSDNIYVADTYNHSIRKITPEGVVTTLAGTGVIGSTNATGTSASFNYPHGVAVDSSGTVYVVDSYNHLIRKITPDGVVTTFTGSDGVFGATDATGAAALFNSPKGITVDSSGTLYVADTGNHRIREITSTGVVTTLAGNTNNYVDGIGILASFASPKALVVESSGKIYVVDGNNIIRKITPALLSGTPTNADVGVYDINLTVSDGNGASDIQNFTITVNPLAPTVTSTPMISVDQDNSYSYILTGSDAQSDTLTWSTTPGTTLPSWLSLNTTDGVATVLAGTSTSGSTDATGLEASFRSPYAMALDSSDNLYVADTYNHSIRMITPAGVVTTLSGTAGVSGFTDATGTAASFDTPKGVAIDSNDNLYVTDSGNHLIRKITPAGVVTTLAGTVGVSGSTDATGTAASFDTPSGIAIDSSDNLYVTDSGNHLIRKITPEGVVTTLAGSGISGYTDATGTAASFNNPLGITVDSSGTIYVVDSYNYLIRKITTDGVVTTLAGNGSYGSTDGIGTEASFFSPNGITVDSSGTLYVADSGNFVIRKITSAGVVTTLSTTISFNFPRGVTVNSSGDLYVADTNNHRIVKVKTASLSGTPTNADVGVYDISLSVSDGTNTTTQTFQITVVNVDDTPTLDALVDVDAFEDASELSITLSATDVDGDNITYTATSSDTSIATVAIVDGKLVVTQVADANGVVSIEVTATANDASVTQSFDFSVQTVNDAPVFGVVSDKIVYKSSGTHTISLPISDIDSNTFTYSYSYNTALLSSVTTDAKVMSVVVVPGVSGSTDINVTVSDGDINVSKVFNFTILPLTDGEDTQELGSIDINETSTTKTITLTIDSNLTLQTQENLDGSVGHSIQIGDKKVTSTSDINGSTVTFNDTGISTQYSDAELSLEVNATLTGEATHKLTVGDTTTRTRSEFVGANTNVTTADNGSIEITTSVTVDANTTVSSVAYADGTAKHTVRVHGKTSQVTSSVKGANTLIKTTGDVETTAGAIADGSGYEMRAIATTLVNGTITTGFVKVSTTDATDTVPQSNILSSGSVFSLGSKVKLLELDSVLMIEAYTTLDENLVIE